MALSFPDLLNILKSLSPNARPKRLDPIVVTAWIQERSNIPIDELDRQYKEGKKELTNKLLGLGYSEDVRKLHLNEMWVLLAELESSASGSHSTAVAGDLNLWGMKILEDHLGLYYKGTPLASLSKVESLELLEDLRVFGGQLSHGDRRVLDANIASD